MKPFFQIFSVLFLVLNACTTSTESKVAKSEIKREHFTIKLVPDLSNRITRADYKCLLADEVLVDTFLNLIYPTILEHKRTVNQLDKFELDFINKKHIQDYTINTSDFVIDFSRFKSDQLKRNDYLGKFSAQSKFKNDKNKFSSSFKALQKNITSKNGFGSDVYSYFSNLTYNDIDTTVKKLEDNKQKYCDTKQNLIILFTDGYLETVYDTLKLSKELSAQKIENFRNDFTKNGQGKTLECYFSTSGYGITPINNPVLKDVKILVLQLFDRNATSTANKKNPTDMKIIKLFWQDWFLKSGIKKEKFILVDHRETYSGEKAKQILCNFIGL